MAVYKDKKRGTWYVSLYYTDWTGKQQRKLKRGFSTKKEAQDWERHFSLEKASSLDMTFVALTKVLYHPTSPSDIDIIRNASRVLEETYHAKEGLFTDVLSTYRSEEESWKKAFLDIVAATAEIEIDEDGYAPYVQQILYYASKDGRDKAEKISSNAVADLLSIGADIKDGDTVLDGAIGYGYSAMKCIQGNSRWG